MRFTLDQQIIEATLNYLASKPFAEVSKLIADIQKDAKPAEETKEESKDGV